MTPIVAIVRVKTTNPNNCAQGTTRGSMFARARKRKEQRIATRYAVLAQMRWARVRGEQLLLVGCVATITRIAPSVGLDPHDGLGAALKGVIDGTADALGLKNDRDDRVKWQLEQKRGAKGYYAVTVKLEAAA